MTSSQLRPKDELCGASFCKISDVASEGRLASCWWSGYYDQAMDNFLGDGTLAAKKRDLHSDDWSFRPDGGHLLSRGRYCVPSKTFAPRPGTLTKRRSLLNLQVV